MAVHLADVMASIGGEKKVIRIHGLPEDADSSAGLNRPTLTSGRMPERSGECVVGVGKIHLDTLELGSVITLEDDDTLKDTLGCRQYTIVGFVSSAYYLSYTLGNTTIGNGTISYYMYVPDSDFTQDAYTDVFVTVAGAKALSAFSAQYGALVGITVDSLETLADSREQVRYLEIRDEAQDKLDDAQRDYDDAKRDADEQLAERPKEAGRRSGGDRRERNEAGGRQNGDRRRRKPAEERRLPDQSKPEKAERGAAGL